MADCVISAKYPPLIDPTRTPLAYGDRAIPKLNRQLQDEVLLTRQRAVRALCDHLRDPEHVAEAIKLGVPLVLKKLLLDSDVTVREKTTETLYIIATSAIGRETWAESKIVAAIADLWDDPEDIVRKNSHMAVEMMAQGPDGAAEILDAALVPRLISKLEGELDEIKLIILNTLHFCLIYSNAVHNPSTSEALDSKGMEVFLSLLTHSNETIRASAARDMFDICVPLAGKQLAVKLKVVETLKDLLSDNYADARAFSASALAMIAITTPGKYKCFHEGVLEPLITLVDDITPEARANALKAITCICEAPEARVWLQNHVETVRVHETDLTPNVAKAAKRAVEVIEWTP